MIVRTLTEVKLKAVKPIYNENGRTIEITLLYNMGLKQQSTYTPWTYEVTI